MEMIIILGISGFSILIGYGLSHIISILEKIERNTRFNQKGGDIINQK